MAGRLEGKRALVFGATGKLGQAVALLFAQEGAALALVSRSRGRLEGLQRRLEPAGANPALVESDPATEKGCRTAVRQAAAHLGGLDILYYGAGDYLAGNVPLEELGQEQWDTLVGSNLGGAFFACKYALPHLAGSGGGSALLMGGTRGDRLVHNAAYAAAKAGLLGLVERLAREWRDRNVRVNAILPYRVSEAPEAQRIAPADGPLNGEAQPEDIAYLALFLASPESRFITGVAIPVDGGRGLLLGR